MNIEMSYEIEGNSVWNREAREKIHMAIGCGWQYPAKEGQGLRGAWSNRKISEQRMAAEGIYIPMEQNSTEINQFRSISLLNVKEKIFFSVRASRLTKYLTEKKGRKWEVAEATDKAKECLKIKEVIGQTQRNGFIIPKLLWPLLIYEICSTTVEAIEGSPGGG